MVCTLRTSWVALRFKCIPLPAQYYIYYLEVDDNSTNCIYPEYADVGCLSDFLLEGETLAKSIFLNHFTYTPSYICTWFCYIWLVMVYCSTVICWFLSFASFTLVKPTIQYIKPIRAVVTPRGGENWDSWDVMRLIMSVSLCKSWGTQGRIASKENLKICHSYSYYVPCRGCKGFIIPRCQILAVAQRLKSNSIFKLCERKFFLPHAE